MSETQWVNPHQPQTLYLGTVLCYVDAVTGLIFRLPTLSFVVTLVICAGLGAGGFGVANEKKWGYAVAVAAAVAQILALVAVFSSLTPFSGLLTFGFDAALIALLLHPMSRNYQRIWFR